LTAYFMWVKVGFRVLALLCIKFSQARIMQQVCGPKYKTRNLSEPHLSKPSLKLTPPLLQSAAFVLSSDEWGGLQTLEKYFQRERINNAIVSSLLSKIRVSAQRFFMGLSEAQTNFVCPY